MPNIIIIDKLDNTNKIITKDLITPNATSHLGRTYCWLNSKQTNFRELSDVLWQEVFGFLNESDIFQFRTLNSLAHRLTKHSVLRLAIQEGLGTELFLQAKLNGLSKRGLSPKPNLLYIQLKGGQSSLRFECLYNENIPFVLTICKYRGKILFDWQKKGIYSDSLERTSREHGSLIPLNNRLVGYIQRLVAGHKCGLLMKSSEEEIGNVKLKGE